MPRGGAPHTRWGPASKGRCGYPSPARVARGGLWEGGPQMGVPRDARPDRGRVTGVHRRRTGVPLPRCRSPARVAAARRAAAVRVRHVAAHRLVISYGPARSPRGDGDARRLGVRDVRTIEPRRARAAVVPALQRSRTDGRCDGDIGVPDRIRHLPRRGARAPLAADRSPLPLDSDARGAAHAAHDPARGDLAVPRRQRRRDPEPIRRALARVGRAGGGVPLRAAVAGGRAQFHGARDSHALRLALGAGAHSGDRPDGRRRNGGVRAVDVSPRRLVHPDPRARVALRPADLGDPRHPPLRRLRYRPR